MEQTEVDRMPFGRFWACWRVRSPEWEKEKFRKNECCPLKEHGWGSDGERVIQGVLI